MDKQRRTLELLAPAANSTIAIEAIKHGADAVYMGATSHGARKAAANSIEDIARVVEFAHKFCAKVYVTVNTIIFEDELQSVEKLCRDLYTIGTDALIVQDMSLLRMDIPPIALHASTQCDIRTPEKAKFLQEVGFSQLVLARELTIKEIKSIVDTVTIPVECFIHGALCVSYSGRCHASCATTGRSANRGECSQLCRLPYSLIDSEGKTLVADQHLLSLRDLNATAQLPLLIEAGVSSFKIEGRLKELDYVKNVVAHYSQKLNTYIDSSNGNLKRASVGETTLKFNPQPEKSFNRGFTEYFLINRRPNSIASVRTPKSMGELIKDMKLLNNGDGISFFNNAGVYEGVNINRVDNGRIIPGRKVVIPRNAEIHRTHDVEWLKKMKGETALRKIGIDVEIDEKGVTASDRRGNKIRLAMEVNQEVAKKNMDYEKEFRKLGNTIYSLDSYKSSLPDKTFIPLSEISKLRRNLTEALDFANNTTYSYDRRRLENKDYKYFDKSLDFKDNVANSLAERFYRDHGVVQIEKAMEINPSSVIKGSTVLMTTRHCILRELGKCKKRDSIKVKEPLYIKNGGNLYRLQFDCHKCEMRVLKP